MLCENIVENHYLPNWAIQPMRFRAMAPVMIPKTIRPFFEVMAGMQATSIRRRMASRVESMMIISGVLSLTPEGAKNKGIKRGN